MNQRKAVNFIPLLLMLLTLFSIVAYVFQSLNTVNLPYSDLVELFEKEQVSSFEAGNNIIKLELREPYEGRTSLRATFSNETAFRQEMGELLKSQLASGVLETYNFLPESKPSIFTQALPYLLAGTVLLTLWMFMAARANGNGNPMASFGKANTNTNKDKRVTFDDVAGADEEKAELQEVVSFLRDPDQFAGIGATIPKGFLMVGPPGTGKTLLARAVAGESDVRFLSISGSDFMELYVGVGASRVRDLFAQAKRIAPAVIFIDEIDAIGRQRGSGIGGGHDEREQTLNQLLVEMDGFEKNENVIVLAATNRADILDPALLRPGRFDRQIHVGVPVASGREDILKVHAKGKRLAEDVDLHAVAQATAGFTGADLANLLNEAAILAVRNHHPALTMQDLDEAMMKILAGPEKKSWKMLERERQCTAIHEAGHAIASYHLPTNEPVHKITIIPRGNALGMTIYSHTHDTFGMTRNEMFEQIVSLLGGRVAEQLYLQDISTGASNDLQRASDLARDMVGKYGMSDAIGPVSYISSNEVFIGRDYEKTKSYSERVASDMDAAVRAIVEEAYAKCEEILKAEESKLHQVADFLLAHESMSDIQFIACMEGKKIPDDADQSFFQSPS